MVPGVRLALRAGLPLALRLGVVDCLLVLKVSGLVDCLNCWVCGYALLF